MQNSNQKRRKRLIKPDFQLKLIGSFGGVAVLAMLLQFLMLGYFLPESVSELENGGQLASQVPGSLIKVLGLSLVLLTPVFLMIGVALTFRIAGPIYRFEQHLAALARGEKLGPCKIRQGDHFQSLCDAINLATEALSAEDQLEGGSSRDGKEKRSAA